MSEARYDLACATLQQLGLWPQEPQRHLDASQAPVYTEQDVIRETHTSREFEAITGETQRRLGRVLSNEELKILLSIYRYLGLPGEVISILVNYCIQRQRSRGIARMPSLRSIEKEAYYWADHGIDTMEQAAVYMQNQLLRQSQLGKIKELFGISGRRLTPGEENYILTWLSWGFGEKEIGLAYEKDLPGHGRAQMALLQLDPAQLARAGLHDPQPDRSGRPRAGQPKDCETGIRSAAPP